MREMVVKTLFGQMEKILSSLMVYALLIVSTFGVGTYGIVSIQYYSTLILRSLNIETAVYSAWPLLPLRWNNFTVLYELPLFPMLLQLIIPAFLKFILINELIKKSYGQLLYFCGKLWRLRSFMYGGRFVADEIGITVSHPVMEESVLAETCNTHLRSTLVKYDAASSASLVRVVGQDDLVKDPKLRRMMGRRLSISKSKRRITTRVIVPYLQTMDKDGIEKSESLGTCRRQPLQPDVAMARNPFINWRDPLLYPTTEEEYESEINLFEDDRFSVPRETVGINVSRTAGKYPSTRPSPKTSQLDLHIYTLSKPSSKPKLQSKALLQSTIVYIPPMFKYKVWGFLATFWSLSVFIHGCAFFLPLCIGRCLAYMFVNTISPRTVAPVIHDTFSCFLGLIVCFPTLAGMRYMFRIVGTMRRHYAIRKHIFSKLKSFIGEVIVASNNSTATHLHRIDLLVVAMAWYGTHENVMSEYAEIRDLHINHLVDVGHAAYLSLNENYSLDEMSQAEIDEIVDLFIQRQDFNLDVLCFLPTYHNPLARTTFDFTERFREISEIVSNFGRLLSVMLKYIYVALWTCLILPLLFGMVLVLYSVNTFQALYAGIPEWVRYYRLATLQIQSDYQTEFDSTVSDMMNLETSTTLDFTTALMMGIISANLVNELFKLLDDHRAEINQPPAGVLGDRPAQLEADRVPKVFRGFSDFFTELSGLYEDLKALKLSKYSWRSLHRDYFVPASTVFVSLLAFPYVLCHAVASAIHFLAVVMLGDIASESEIEEAYAVYWSMSSLLAWNIFPLVLSAFVLCVSGEWCNQSICNLRSQIRRERYLVGKVLQNIDDKREPIPSADAPQAQV